MRFAKRLPWRACGAARRRRRSPLASARRAPGSAREGPEGRSRSRPRRLRSRQRAPRASPSAGRSGARTGAVFTRGSTLAQPDDQLLGRSVLRVDAEDQLPLAARSRRARLSAARTRDRRSPPRCRPGRRRSARARSRRGRRSTTSVSGSRTEAAVPSRSSTRHGARGRRASRGVRAMSRATRAASAAPVEMAVAAAVALLDEPERRIEERRRCSDRRRGSSPAATALSRPARPARSGARVRGNGRSSRTYAARPARRRRRTRRRAAARGAISAERAPVVGTVLEQVGAHDRVDAVVVERQVADVRLQQPGARERPRGPSPGPAATRSTPTRSRRDARVCRSSSRYPVEQPRSAIVGVSAGRSPIRVEDRAPASRGRGKCVRDVSSCRLSSSIGPVHSARIGVAEERPALTVGVQPPVVERG